MDRVERYTYRLHVMATIPESMFLAMIWASAEVAKKNMDADIKAVTLITMAPGVAMLFSLFITGRLQGFDRRKLLMGSALIGRLPLVLMFFTTNVWVFLGLMVIQSFAFVPITACQNALFRTNYSNSLRGTLYGKAQRYGSMAMAIMLFGSGFYLDLDREGYRHIYPLLALLGLLSCSVFARIQVRPGHRDLAQPARLGAIGTLRDTLLADRNFLRYELAFFIYGVSFMAAMTAKPIFGVDSLLLTNGQLLGAKACYCVTVVLCTPFMGRLMDRVGPARLATRCYSLLVIHMFILLVTQNAYGYFVAEILFGVCMSGVLIAWNMGPVTLAPEGDALRYMGVHVALVGVRAMIGHPMGGAILETSEAVFENPADTGSRIVFGISAILMIVAAVVMGRLARSLDAQKAAA